jgi:hypothetical protein
MHGHSLVFAVGGQRGLCFFLESVFHKSWFYGAKVRKRNCSSKFSRPIFEMITPFSVWNAVLIT